MINWSMNSQNDLAEFFSTPDRPVTLKEFLDFWDSIDGEEKIYYRTADLK